MSIHTIIMSQGKFMHRDSLKYPFEERGLQFGDGVYEVIQIYNGNFYLFDEHLTRLYNSLKAIEINLSITKEDLADLLHKLLEKNKMQETGHVYLQVTRGSAPRVHTFPEDTEPNIYAYVKTTERKEAILTRGVETITYPDERWKHCYIKSLNLLPNIIAKQKAKEAGAYEAILHKDGLVTECGSSNVYLVKKGEIYTYPANGDILHGCVRIAVERFSKELNLPFIEEAFTVNDFATADEVFLTSSTNEVLPIIKVDETIISDGKPGPITQKLQAAYRKDAKL